MCILCILILTFLFYYLLSIVNQDFLPHNDIDVSMIYYFVPPTLLSPCVSFFNDYCLMSSQQHFSYCYVQFLSSHIS